MGTQGETCIHTLQEILITSLLQESGEEFSGHVIEIPITLRQNAGMYTCYANNGWIQESTAEVWSKIC